MSTEHLGRLERALASELEWQRREHEAALRQPLPDRVAAGVSWAPLTVESTDLAGRGRLLVRLLAPRRATLHDGIGTGDRVVVAPIGSPDDGVEGTSLGAEGRVAEVLVEAPWEATGPLAVTRRFDPTTFARYRAALRRAADKPTPLRDVLLGLREPSPANVAPVAIRSHLNAAQRAAVEAALVAPEVALVHGPPGTGKTETIVALLEALVAEGDRPWALADSNAAVDHLALRASRAGLEVVRVGHALRIGSEAAKLSLDARVAAGPSGPVLRDLDRAIVRARSASAHREVRQLLEERDAIEARARAAALAGAQVIASTLGTLARAAPDLPPARTAIVDEATQAIEPAIWVAVPFVERLVLVGDPHQLGPVVVEPGNPLARSLLQRLLDETALPLPMLAIQHRMHAAIQALVEPIYGEALRPHPTVAGHLLRDLPGVAATPLTERSHLWVDLAGAGEEARDPATRSLYSAPEVAVVARAVAQLLAAGVRPRDVGVIAPYSAQVERLRAQPDLREVEVATVNAFQGREKEAIVCSFVRSNPDGDLGFVADVRRLTVALTRARRLLVCVGDTATLASSPPFARVIDVFHATGAWASVWEPAWSPLG